MGFDFVMTNQLSYLMEEEVKAPHVSDGQCRTDMSFNKGVHAPVVHYYRGNVDDSEGGDMGFVLAIVKTTSIFAMV